MGLVNAAVTGYSTQLNACRPEPDATLGTLYDSQFPARRLQYVLRVATYQSYQHEPQNHGQPKSVGHPDPSLAHSESHPLDSPWDTS